MKPKFSIVIPVYNVVSELPRAVQSVFVQDFSDWEVVLVDDGSTDGSAEVCDDYAEKDSRVLVAHQQNAGVVSARIKGVGMSHGQWIMFLDGDDEISADCLSTLDRSVNSQTFDFVQFGFERFEMSGETSIFLPSVEGLKSAAWVVEHAGKSPLNLLTMCIGNKCYRREIVEKAFQDVSDIHIKNSEDALFALAAFFHADNIMFERKCLYKYIMRSTSAVHRVNLEIAEEKQRFLDRSRELAKKSGRMDAEQISTMIGFHSYETCCYTLHMLIRNHASLAQMRKVLIQLTRQKCYTSPNPEWRTFKRSVLKFLLKWPILCAIFSKIGLLR